MFTKSFFFILSVTGLALSNSLSHEPVKREAQQSLLGTVDGWLQSVENSLLGFYEEGKEDFEEILTELNQKVKSEELNGVEIGKEKLAEIKKKFEEIKEKAKAAIDHVRNIWQARLEEWRSKGQGALDKGKKSLEELKNKAKQAIDHEKIKWEAIIEEWRKKVQQIIESVNKKI